MRVSFVNCPSTGVVACVSVRVMKQNSLASFARRMLLPLASVWLAAGACQCGSAAGVTLITHGLNGNVDGWITGMATNLPNYRRFPGASFTGYEMSFSNFNNAYYLTAARVAGSQPTNPSSGEIVVLLDWRQLADGSSYNTYQVASAVVPALLSTNFIPELGGHALAELPLHLIGHSRGGSLMCEVSRLLGTNGVWVDHLTTLDPHPLNDPTFPLDVFVGNAVDAPANTYENVLFHDNYWQEAAFGVTGLPVMGAYVRKLTAFSGGYSGLGHQHSDVHLWYHGTLDWRVPTSDTEAVLTSAERSSWWGSYEKSGTNAGFNYSLIGGADRTSTDQPLGFGSGAVRDGHNQWWDLGAGTLSNRTALPLNNGGWPNLIKFNRTTTNAVVQGQSTPLKFYYQWAQPDTNLATVSIFLDDEGNPRGTNQVLLCEFPVPGNGVSSVSFTTTNVLLAASNAAPGYHTLFARISGGGRSRFLSAPESVQVVAVPQPPALAISRLTASHFRIVISGSPGQMMVLQDSTDLQLWQPLATNTLVGNQWVCTNSPLADPPQHFYRAVLP
jgi:hypothetical protein